ncbi:MAG TPA: hypothetical protein VN675_06850 [Burkholderiales bacterium]|nr:hypothetical protein [Burkholderiales bacterium]
MRFAVLVAATVLALPVRADVGINLYGLSWHLNADKAHAQGMDNWFNPGLGLRYRVPGERFDYFLDAGFYRDSARNTAVLAGGAAYWRATEHARLGLALVVFNSKTYNDGKTFVTPLPLFGWEFGPAMLNVMWSPRVREINEVNTLGFWLTYWLR